MTLLRRLRFKCHALLKIKYFDDTSKPHSQGSARVNDAYLYWLVHVFVFYILFVPFPA